MRQVLLLSHFRDDESEVREVNQLAHGYVVMVELGFEPRPAYSGNQVSSLLLFSWKRSTSESKLLLPLCPNFPLSHLFVLSLEVHSSSQISQALHRPLGLLPLYSLPTEMSLCVQL